MTYIVTSKWLNDRLENNVHTVIIDARFQLDDPNFGKNAYAEGHIPQAVFLDIEKDLSGPVKKHGGNHPLPSKGSLAKRLGDSGVDQDTTVVVYDQENDMFAPRLWWTLHYLGHKHVYILDGGINGWIEEGYPITNDVPTPKSKEFEPNLLNESVVDIEQVKEKLSQSSAILIDSRSEDRYLGLTEPLYEKAGHIPGAKNYYWEGVLDNSGRWKRVEQLKEHFSALNKDEEIIVSCGSGVSACPNIIGLTLAGFTNVKLYTGGYSDWLSYEENPINTKEE